MSEYGREHARDPDRPARGNCEACSGTGLVFSRTPAVDVFGQGRYLQTCPTCNGLGRCSPAGDSVPRARVDSDMTPHDPLPKEYR